MDNQKISNTPDRSKMYQGQTPQSFHAKRLREVFDELSEEEKTQVIRCGIMALSGEEI